MSGIEQLMECVTMVLARLDGIEKKLDAGEGTRAPVEDMTRPLTAEELCERWYVTAPNDELRLLYLSRKCQAWGLKPLRGTRGWAALYSRADVLHAESFAGGKIKRRKHAA
jgi:hypothetical protein